MAEYSGTTIKNTGCVLMPTRQEDRWSLVTEGEWISGRPTTIRYFNAPREIGAVLWAEAWATLKKLPEVPATHIAFMSSEVVAEQVYAVPPVYYLLVLVDRRLDYRHRYLMREGHLPILFPGCEDDEQAVQEATDLVARGALDD